MNKQQMNSLQQICSRVNFDHVERKLYSHDIGVMPSLVTPLIGKPMADAVAQPQSEQELIDLVKWANTTGVPLTPRGKASSGYGGAIPVRKGVVVDFYRMKSILKIDKKTQTATVEPGITWEQLDRQLKAQGLTLRTYPSSYPSASVGGWLAQGGAGLGSYEFGYFRENVVSARIVLPNGEGREFGGDDLDLIADANGITGFISQITIKVQTDSELDILSIACGEHQSFQNLLEAIIKADLPIWSMLFINPKMAELKNQSPHVERNWDTHEENVTLPVAYILTVTVKQQHSQLVRTALGAILSHTKAQLLSNNIAQHEWNNRFKLMTVKRLGPSLIPTEVVVPLKNLSSVLEEINKKVAQPLVKEGVIVHKGLNGEAEAIILGFIPADERKFSYNFAFVLALTVIKIAEKYNGRAYSTGLYFANKAVSVLGKERLEKLRQFKLKVDPAGIFNPGKVINTGILGTFMSLANYFESLVRPFGNAVKLDIGERPKEAVRDIPPDVVWYAYSCSQCGYCVDECDQFYGRGWESQSPRGKWYWLREYMQGKENWDQKMVDTFLVCTTCELCNLRCSAALPIESSWMKLRGQLIDKDKRMTFPPFEMMAAATRSQGDIWAGYRKDRANWFPIDLMEKHGPDHKAKSVYFAGCTASYVENDIAIGTVRLLDAAGVDFTYLGTKESCCAIPMLVSGKWDVFEQTMKRNIAEVTKIGADTVIASCPACDMMWRQVYPEWAKKLGIEYHITTKHYSEIVTEQLKNGKFKFPANKLPKQTVTWHDSCHIGRVSGVYEPPRELIKAIPNVDFVEMNFNREEAHCCGSVLTLIKDPPIAAEIGKDRLDEVIESGAQKVLALCPCCEFQLRVTAQKKNTPIEVIDLSAFSAKALGFNLPDPHPQVKAQWAVFEAMIALMTPQGFATLMGTMWSDLVDAMPMGMGGMMRFMGKKMPFMLNMMKPIFPILFPILLPMMMPKVMPVMLSRVADQVPMPQYMAEQMPELMPKVMDNLMPHMIGELVPLVTQPMIDYLKK